MAKTRAYTSQDGDDMVTAAQIGWLRKSNYNGRPTGDTYFSTHAPGKRKVVKHVMRARWFFAYKESGDRDSPASGGESLDHLLFKEVLCSLKRTKLSLYVPTMEKPKKWRDVLITITHTQREKPVPRSEGDPYRADVYMTFETEDMVGLKWEKRVYIEVCHKHAVGAHKQTELRDLRIPVVEVEIPKELALDFHEDDTNDQKEEAYRCRIKRILESENGFLKGVVLSNPSSMEYLEWLVSAQKREISKLQKSESQLKESLRSGQEELATITGEKAGLVRKLASQSTTLASTQLELGRTNTAVTQLGNTISSLEEEVSQLKFLRLWLSVLCAMLVVAFLVAIALVVLS